MFARTKKLVQTMVYGVFLVAAVQSIAGEIKRAPASALSVISDRKLRNLLPAVPVYSYGLTNGLPSTGEHRIKNALLMNLSSEFEIANSGQYLTRSHSAKPYIPGIFEKALRAPASP